MIESSSPCQSSAMAEAVRSAARSAALRVRRDDATDAAGKTARAATAARRIIRCKRMANGSARRRRPRSAVVETWPTVEVGCAPVARVVVLVGVLVAAALLPASARACDARKLGRAEHHARARGRAPLIIGDSTLILAAPTLGRFGIEADAKGCRQFAEGVRILAARRHAGT